MNGWMNEWEIRNWTGKLYLLMMGEQGRNSHVWGNGIFFGTLMGMGQIYILGGMDKRVIGKICGSNEIHDWHVVYFLFSWFLLSTCT